MADKPALIAEQSYEENKAPQNASADVNLDKELSEPRIEPGKAENINDKLVAKNINLDLNLAKLSTESLLVKLALFPVQALFNKLGYVSDTHNTFENPGFFGHAHDMLMKVRQQCLYSIHARPGYSFRQPDDISADAVHSLQAHALGNWTYKMNAFVAPFISVLKIFFPFKQFGIFSRVLQGADDVIRYVTSIFWNMRRISKGLIAYDGGITSSELLEKKQRDVRNLLDNIFTKTVVNNLIKVKGLLTGKSKAEIERRLKVPSVNYTNFQMRQKLKGSVTTWLKNVRALLPRFSVEKRIVADENAAPGTEKTKTVIKRRGLQYECAHEGLGEDGKPIKKVLGALERENNKFYVWSKVLSQVVGLPVGIASSLFNISAIGTTSVGALFKNEKMQKYSQWLNDQANSLMALVYIPNEVQSNLNEFMKLRKKGHTSLQHLLVFGTGLIGMAARISKGVLTRPILSLVGLDKPLIKRRRFFDTFFNIFWTANRWVLHSKEKQEAMRLTSSVEKEDVAKHDSFSARAALPLRILSLDKDVVYTKDDNSPKA